MTTVEQSTPPPEPARVLGAISASCVVIGAIIGVGIFFAPSSVVKLTHTGALALTAWAVAGGIALCGALTFGALGVRYHAQGAQYQILRDAYGPLPAFLFVFCNATAVQAGAIGIIAVVCAQNLAAAAGLRPEALGRGELLSMAGLLVLGVTGANMLGVRWGAAIQNVTVFSKVLTLLAVAALAIFWAPGAPPAPVAPAPDAPPIDAGVAIAGVMAALVPAFFAYGGWQHALWISGEVREPRRTLPRAIVGGVVLVVVVYLLVNWAYLRLLGDHGVAASEALAADATAVVLPGVGRRLIAAAVAVSAFGVLNAQLLSGPRLVYGMAREGQFFGAFGRLGRRFGTPVAAIVLLSAMAAVLLLADLAFERLTGAEETPIDRLLTGVVLIDGVFFGLTGAAFFVLRRRSGRDPGANGATPLRVLGYPFVPALFVLGELALVAGSFLAEEVRVGALAGAAWIGVACVLYWVSFRRGRGAA